MNIEELLNGFQSFKEELETVEVKEVEVIEPEVDAKGEKTIADLVKAFEDYQTELDTIKAEDPELKFEMIDNKDPMQECDALQKATEKQNRKEEIKKGINKRVKKPEVIEQPVEESVEENIDESMLDVANKTDKVDLEKVVIDNPETKEIELPEPEVDCEKEVAKAIEEPKEVKVEDIVKIEESIQDEVVAKYETTDGKHEIIRTSEGLYKNRYYLKENGKARRTTRGVKNLPTAVGAMMKRFPEAVEITEPTETK